MDESLNQAQNLPTWALILIIVAISIAGLFLIYCITVFAFFKTFANKNKSHNSAINLLLNERFELMKRFIKLIESHGVLVAKEDIKSIEKLERIDDYQLLEKADRDERLLSFVHASHNLLSTALKSEEVVNDLEYSELINHFNELEEDYRQKSALYNSDIIGYNYWINVPIMKRVFKLFRVKQKDLII